MAHKPKKAQAWQITAIAALGLLLCGMLMLVWLLPEPSAQPPAGTDPAESTLPILTTPPPETTLPEEETSVFVLGQGLVITQLAPYTGAYMEDGSDHIVSDVLMVILENRSDQALQYASFRISFSDTAADFSVTSLPAGARAVVLEKNRMAYPAQTPSSITVETALFQPTLELYPELFAISGQKGLLTVKNCSDTPISGDIYVYYKNSAQDIFYGGITYRARVDGGLAPGESKNVLASHYNPTGSTLVMVTYQP